MTLMMQNRTFQTTNNIEKTRSKTFDKNMFVWIYLPKWKRFNFGEHAKGAQKITYKCSDVCICNLFRKHPHFKDVFIIIRAEFTPSRIQDFKRHVFCTGRRILRILMNKVHKPCRAQESKMILELCQGSA